METMSDNYKADTVVADRTEYENLVVESEFKNDVVITISKEPGDSDYYVYFSNLCSSKPDAVYRHDLTHRLPCNEVLKIIKQNINDLKNNTKQNN